MIDISQDRINAQVIYRFALAQVVCTSKCLLNNSKQNITSLSLFVGTIIAMTVRAILNKNRNFTLFR